MFGIDCLTEVRMTDPAEDVHVDFQRHLIKDRLCC